MHSFGPYWNNVDVGIGTKDEFVPFSSPADAIAAFKFAHDEGELTRFLARGEGFARNKAAIYRESGT